MLFSVKLVAEEVLNGGFAQLVRNVHPSILREAAKSFEVLGEGPIAWHSETANGLP